MPRWMAAAAAVPALACATTAFGADGLPERQQRIDSAAFAHYAREIARFERSTSHWQRVMGVRPTRLARRTLAGLSVPSVKRLAQRWHRLWVQVRNRSRHPPDLAPFLCIHRYEGRWTAVDPPYYGGLQMDMTFQQSYGGWLLRLKGTANNWSPLEQIWTAERAVRSRGFEPWPTSAALCGLL